MRQLTSYCEEDLSNLFEEMEQHGIHYSNEQWEQINEVIKSLKKVKREEKLSRDQYKFVNEFSNLGDDSTDEDDDDDDDEENLLDTKMNFLGKDVDFGKIINDPETANFMNQINSDNIYNKPIDELTLREWLSILMMYDIEDKNKQARIKYPHLYNFNMYGRKENTKRELEDVRKSLDGKNKFTKATDYQMGRLAGVLSLPAIDKLLKMVPDLVMNSKCAHDLLGGRRPLINFNPFESERGQIMNEVVDDFLGGGPLTLINRLQANDQAKTQKL